MCSRQKFLPSQKFLPTQWTSSSLAVQKLFSFLRCHLWTGILWILEWIKFCSKVLSPHLYLQGVSSTVFSTSAFTKCLWSIGVYYYTWYRSNFVRLYMNIQHHLVKMFFSPVYSHYENQCTEFSESRYDLSCESHTSLLDICPNNLSSYFTDNCCSHVHCYFIQNIKEMEKTKYLSLHE